MRMTHVASTIDQIKGDYQTAPDFVLSVVLMDETGKVLFEDSGDCVLHAASLIKVPILLKALVDFEAGNLKLSEKIQLKQSDKVGGCGILTLMDDGSDYSILEILKLMICVSDNTATNLMIERLGIDAINAFLATLHLQGTQVARKLMIGDMSRFSTTTASDMTQLLRMLLVPGLLSEDNRKLGLEILQGQQFNDRLSHEWFICGNCGAKLGHWNICQFCETSVAVVEPFAVPFAHKTGEITGMVHDAGILTLDGKHFILAALTQGLLKNTDGQVILSRVGNAVLSDLHGLLGGGD